MWYQLKGILRNLILFPTLVAAGLLVYSIFILRGRSIGVWDVLDDPALSLMMRTWDEIEDDQDEFQNLSFCFLRYNLRELPDGRYEREVSNNSWRPFLVMMYEFPDWKYRLPDSELLHYASRYTVRNDRTGLEIDSGTGFDCGSGLGLTLIRPWETFVDTVGFEKLMPTIHLRHQITLSENGIALDYLTGRRLSTHPNEQNEFDESLLLTMVPDDELEVRLYLPVRDYFSGEPERVYANSFTVSRWALLEREMKEHAKIQAEITD